MEKGKIKFIYWFAYYNLDSPSVRYRAKYPLDFIQEKLGIQSYFVIPGYTPKQVGKFLIAYLSALIFRKKDSLIVVQRVRSNFIYANLLKLLVKIRRRNSIYDLDDADYLSYNPLTIQFFARNCEFISAGSEEIAKYFKQFNQRTFHVTSPTVDLSITKKKRNKIFTIGWIGGYGWGHKDSLYNFVFPAIKGVSFLCKFILLGVTNDNDRKTIEEYFEGAKNVTLEMPLDVDWNNEYDIQDYILSFDIGIATLLNNPIQLAKSGIKVKQYMNNGIPVLSTNLPENNNYLTDGVNGYFCDSIDDFKKRILQFKTMPEDVYQKFSKSARNSISNFNHTKYIQEFEQMKTQQD